MANIYIDQFHTGVFKTRITGIKGESLYQALGRHQIAQPGAVCRGAGVCRGCMVQILEEGMECLACRYIIGDRDLHIVMDRPVSEQGILLFDMKTDDSQEENWLSEHLDELASFQYGLAIDIGTTTIASALVELASGRIILQHGCMNRQAGYGADVISRIQYATEQHGTGSGLEILSRSIREDLQLLYQCYLADGIPEQQICRASISGNTTMIQLLLKLDVSGMAAYPFTPLQLDGIRLEWQEKDICILPGKSAFVGGDIVSGVQSLEMGRSEAYELLIDLGTNGELWLLNRETGVCTSTSCGPAFANSVSQGTAYGTTLLDELAAAYHHGVVDESGLLQGDAFEHGILKDDIVITQDTVRQLQLAKAAIRTGIELSAYELRLPLQEISQVYLAGGFGFYLNPESAYCLGLLPEEFRGKLKIAGNTSLKGAVLALTEPERMLKLPENMKNSKVMDLSLNKNFQEFFVHRLSFPPNH